MSKREWEEGTVKLPSAAWAPFKQALQKGMSEHIAHDYELALKLHAALTEQKKGKRGFDISQAFEAEVYAVLPNPYSRFSSREGTPKYPFAVVDTWDVKRWLLGTEKPYTLLKPKKKDFAPYTSASLEFQGASCAVYLDNTTRAVKWDVEEGNHSVKRARNTHLGTLLFTLLAKVQWTRATGGTIVGNDEYNEESRSEGGAGNYVTSRFGPLGEPYIPSFAMPKNSKKTTTTRR